MLELGDLGFRSIDLGADSCGQGDLCAMTRDVEEVVQR